MTGKDDASLTNQVFKLLSGQDTQYYSWINGEWQKTNNWTSSGYSEADACLTFFSPPCTVSQVLMFGMIAVTVMTGVGEALLLAEGISLFGVQTTLFLYNAGMLQSSINAVSNATAAQTASFSTLILQDLALIPTAQSQQEIAVIESTITSRLNSYSAINNTISFISRINETFLTAEQFNAYVQPYYSQPPAQMNTTVMELQLSSTQGGFVRVFDYINTSPSGYWIMRAEDVSGLTPLQIQDKFALPFTPTHLCDVIVNEGNTLDVIIGNGLYGHTGQEIQFYLKDGPAFSQFLNERLIPEI